ncbi:MAG TPA: 3D domain-containing protein [Chloroflexota bacterium]|nr:3D domain-containing protein [Chloroflexota bacterium]
MRLRMMGLVAAVAMLVPLQLEHLATVSAASAQFYVTGYVLQGITATGTYVHRGTCAVDPRIIPLGSYFYISGIGECHAEDTGSAIIGYRIDVWVPTVAEAYALTGWRTVTWGNTNAEPTAATAAPQPHVSTGTTVVARRTQQTWYGRSNVFAHQPTGSVTDRAAQPGYVLASVHTDRCQSPSVAAAGSPGIRPRAAPCS